MRSAESSSASVTPRFASAIAFLNHPNWWLAGGTLRNPIWRSQWMLIRWHKLAIAAYQVLGFHQLDSVNSS